MISLLWFLRGMLRWGLWGNLLLGGLGVEMLLVLFGRSRMGGEGVEVDAQTIQKSKVEV